MVCHKALWVYCQTTLYCSLPCDFTSILPQEKITRLCNDEVTAVQQHGSSRGRPRDHMAQRTLLSSWRDDAQLKGQNSVTCFGVFVEFGAQMCHFEC